MIKRIVIFGAGYVGSSLGVLLAQKYEVIIIDTDPIKVNKINTKQSPIKDDLIEEYLGSKDLNISANISYSNYIKSSDLIILALPTSFDELSGNFDTSILETVLSELNKLKYKSDIVIKSTIPIGFTTRVRQELPYLNITFVPEFLREGMALSDNLYPSRIIIGDTKDKTNEIANTFSSVAKNSPDVLFMKSEEAEAVKLFANTYLATRISFFNELDTFAIEKNLDTKNIIDGLSLDPRIGDYYNNPSFGYGGYCLPKDTKQLLNSYKNIPQEIFSAVINSNASRKKFIVEKVLNKNPVTVGIYKLAMKKESDNYRESAILDIIKMLKDNHKKIIVFDPLLSSSKNYPDFKISNDIDSFKKEVDVILANRMDKELIDVKSKVFSRDLYGKN